MYMNNRETFISYGFEVINQNSFTRPYLWSWRERGDKPCGGLWASPEDSEHSWYTECHKLNGEERNDLYPEGFDEAFSKFVRFRLKGEAKVLEIKTAEDYMDTLMKYLMRLGYNYHMEKCGSGDFDFKSVKDYDIIGINWEKVSQDYDAVRVTWDAIQEVGKLLQGQEGDLRILGLETWAVDSLMLCNLECIEMVD